MAKATPTATIVEALRRRLVELKAKEVEAAEDAIHFKAGPFYVWERDNPLGLISTGHIYVRRTENDFLIEYMLDCARMSLLATAVGALFGIVVWRVTDIASAGMVIAVFFWLMLVAGNYLFAKIRFPARLLNKQSFWRWKKRAVSGH